MVDKIKSLIVIIMFTPVVLITLLLVAIPEILVVAFVIGSALFLLRLIGVL